MKSAASLGLILLSAACAVTPQPAPATPVAGPQPAAVFGSKPAASFLPLSRTAPTEGFELHLQRSGCYGICPAYELTIHGNGEVDYLGAAHVAVSGIQHGHADGQALAALRAQLADPASGSLWGSYTRGKPGCGNWATDMPRVTVEAYVDGHWRRIEHDQGCYGAPAALKSLEQAIDAAAQSEQWVSGRSSY